jgi:hypothetical protein
MEFIKTGFITLRSPEKRQGIAVFRGSRQSKHI